jgi:secretion/DNA translocation related CpaE-like protein
MPDDTRPLLITSDPPLLDDLVRLSAAAGVEFTVMAHAAVSAWSTAPLVVVGADALPVTAARGLPRRDGVVVALRADPEGTPADAWRAAVALGAEHVVELPQADRWMVDRLAEVSDALEDGGPVVSFVPAAGGSGASTMAALVAREAKGLLVDLDAYGLVAPVDAGLRWPDLSATRGRIPAASLRAALPQVHGVHVLTFAPDARGPVPAEALASVLDAGARGFRLTVVDTPRCSGEVARDGWARSDLVIVCVGPHAATAARAPGVIDAVREVCTDVAVVARTHPRDSGIWCDAAAREWDVRCLPPLGHDRALSAGEHPFFAPRSAARSWARRMVQEIAGASPVGRSR